MSEKIIYKSEDEEQFIKYWTDLITSYQAGPRYLPLYLEYLLEESRGRNLLIADKSFVYLVNSKPVAGVLLPLEKHAEYIYGSISGDCIYAPIILDKKVEKKIMTKIDQIVFENKVDKLMYAIDPLDQGKIKYNYLQKYGYLDRSVLIYLVDLKNTHDLLKGCRHGHRSDIKKILKDKDYEVFHIDQGNSDYEIHEEYRRLHHKCSGKVTRPKKTFDLQFEELKAGHAVLFGLSYKKKHVAFSYFDYLNNQAGYFSAADDPEYNHLHLSHGLIYQALEFLKKKGIEYVDMGQPSGASMQLEYYPDKKQSSISLFKRGFPGNFANHYQGVKYFSKELFEFDMNNFIKNYKIK
jgi:hypothetical protein